MLSPRQSSDFSVFNGISELIAVFVWACYRFLPWVTCIQYTPLIPMFLNIYLLRLVVLSGIMVSMLAIGPKVRGLEPVRGWGIFKGDNSPNRASFGEEVKPSDPCRKIFRHVKNPSKYKHILRKAKFVISFGSSTYVPTKWLFVGFPESSGGRMSFRCRYHCATLLHANISPRGWTMCPFVAAVHRRILNTSTWSSSCTARYSDCSFPLRHSQSFIQIFQLPCELHAHSILSSILIIPLSQVHCITEIQISLFVFFISVLGIWHGNI
jgi:hypothetical protein